MRPRAQNAHNKPPAGRRPGRVACAGMARPGGGGVSFATTALAPRGPRQQYHQHMVPPVREQINHHTKQRRYPTLPAAVCVALPRTTPRPLARRVTAAAAPPHLSQFGARVCVTDPLGGHPPPLGQGPSGRPTTHAPASRQLRTTGLAHIASHHRNHHGPSVRGGPVLPLPAQHRGPPLAAHPPPQRGSKRRRVRRGH